MKVIIIGGVAGGASAAARLRRLDECAKITIYEKSGYISYANCGLPYYIGGEIEDREELTLQTPASFSARFNVEVFVRHEVVAIDRKTKSVVVRRLSDGAIVLADEISPDTCRFWDSKTGEKLDKDRFRRDLGNVEGAYQEIMRRMIGE